MSENTRTAIELVDTYAAHNYSPLPVVVTEASGAWLTDVDGRRYLDCLAAYSALNFGHGNPTFIDVAKRQLDRLTLTSRAAHSDWLGPFAQKLARLAGKDMVLPMNTGAEAVETAIKVARKWGHQVKGLPQDRGEIIAMHGNFHGRTTTIISFSDDETISAPTAPDSGSPTSATSNPCGRPSHPRPLPCCWNPSRARPASSCRRRDTSAKCGNSPAGTTSC